MRLDSVREVKEELRSVLPGLLRRHARRPRCARVFPAAVPSLVPARPLGLGISGTGPSSYRLAVRIQDLRAGTHSLLGLVREKARGEIEVRLVGKVVKQGASLRRRLRPLRIGCSVGHMAVTAGTLGAFVRVRSKGGDRILSNNHVLANENRGKRGDPVLQPGPADGGTKKRNLVAKLDRFVRLKQRGANTVDAALATVAEGISYLYAFVEGRGELRGVASAAVPLRKRVYKVGRTTGLTGGRISAFEVDHLVVGYDMGDLTFDGQLEIEPAPGGGPFSLGGDSGSLIVDEDLKAVGLLFAGNDVDATYANPIQSVLKALGAELLL